MSHHDSFILDLHAFLVQDANVRVYLGLLDGLDSLPDPTLAAGQERIDGASALLNQLDALPPADAPADRLDQDLARLTLERILLQETHTWNGRTHREQCPRASDVIGDPLFLSLIHI